MLAGPLPGTTFPPTIRFLRLPPQIIPNRGWGGTSNNRNSFSHSLGDQKSNIEVISSVVPSRVSEGESSLCPLVASGGR